MRPLRPFLLLALAPSPAVSAAPVERVLSDVSLPLPNSAERLASLNDRVLAAPAGDAPWKVLPLTYQVWNVAPSPDGERLALVRDRPAVLSVRTGAVQAEMPGGDGCVQPSWDGEGRRLVVWCPRGARPDDTRYNVANAEDHQLVLWDVETRKTRVLEVPAGVTHSVAWVAPRDAWWMTASERPGVLGTWVTPEGRVADEPAPAGVEVGRWPAVAWSPDGLHGAARLGDRDPVVVPVSWSEGRLVAGAPWPAPEGTQGGAFVTPDGRVWLGGTYGPQYVLRPDGHQLWTNAKPLSNDWSHDVTAPVHPVWKAVFLATGQCPSRPEPAIGNYGERRASPDGRWAVHEQWIDHVATGDALPLPAQRYVPDVVVHAEVRPGRWLVTLHGAPAVIDVGAGRFTWAMEHAEVLAASGAHALLLDTKAHEVVRLDLEDEQAWRSPVAQVFPDGDAAWLLDVSGTLRRVRPDGVVTHRIVVPTKAAATARWQTGTWWGWHAWSDGEVVVATFAGAPDVVRTVTSETSWFGFVEQPPFCGTGYTPPAIGWFAVDGVHVLDDQGHEHVLGWGQGEVRGTRGEVVPAPTADTVRGWLRDLADDALHASVRTEHGRVSLTLIGADGRGAEVGVRWSLPHPADAARLATWEAERSTAKPAPPLDLRALERGGWVLVRPDGSASGKDPAGVLVRDVADVPVRPTPLHVAAPWKDPPPAPLGPCAWDRP